MGCIQFYSSSDAYILDKGTVTNNDTSAVGANANSNNEKLTFKNCAPFTNCITEINNTQIDNTKDIGTVMSMYNLLEYSNNYSKTSRSLWQYCKDIPAVDNGNIVNFNGANATDLLNFKVKITDQTDDDDGETDNVKIMVPLKYLSNFWRTLEMPRIICEDNLIFNWSENYVIVYTDVANQDATFTITETKLHVPVVTLLTEDNAKLLM